MFFFIRRVSYKIALELTLSLKTHTQIYKYFMKTKMLNHIGGVMVCMLVQSVLDLGFKGQVDPKTVKLVFAAYPLSTQY